MCSLVARNAAVRRNPMQAYDVHKPATLQAKMPCLVFAEQLRKFFAGVTEYRHLLRRSSNLQVLQCQLDGRKWSGR